MRMHCSNFCGTATIELKEIGSETGTKIIQELKVKVELKLSEIC